MQAITLFDSNSILNGESINDYVANRGFSKESYGLNLMAEKGVLYFMDLPTSRGTNVTNDIIASTIDPSYLGNDTYHLDDGGAFYTVNGATVTKRQTDSTNTFNLGTSDLITFRGATFATSTTEVTYLTGSNLTTIDATWWTVTRSHSALGANYRHPMEVVEDTLYIADQYYIHTWDGSTSVSQAMSLPQDVNITSLRRHPDGRHLIAFCGISANYSHTRAGGGRIYLIDTINLEWVSEIITETQVEGSLDVGGVIYATYGKNVGYFNGAGLEFLRELETSATTYSHCLGAMEDILLVRDGVNVLAYGNLGAGRVWWNLYRYDSNTITNIQYKGDNKLLVADNATNLYEVDYDNKSIYGRFETNRINSAGQVWIRKILVYHTETADVGTFAFDVISIDQNDDTTTIKQPSYINTGGISITRVDCNILTTNDKLRINPSNAGIGYKKIVIYVENGE